MSPTQEAAMKMALEALEIMQPEVQIGEGDAAIKALKAALAEPQEPGVWVQPWPPKRARQDSVKFWPLAPLTGYYDVGGKRVWLEKDDPFPQPTPPQRSAAV